MRTVLQSVVNLMGRVAYSYFGMQLEAPAPYFKPNTVEPNRAVRGVWQ